MAFIVIGAVFSGLGVALGAFGAHGLEERLTADRLDVYEVGVRYQMYHSLALIAIGLLGERRVRVRAAGIAMILGIVLFSGSLYALALSGQTWLGAVTPLGGLAWLVGWGVLAWSASRRVVAPPEEVTAPEEEGRGR